MIIDIKNKQLILEGHDFNGRNLESEVSFSALLGSKRDDRFYSGSCNTARDSLSEEIKVLFDVITEPDTIFYNKIYLECTSERWTVDENAELIKTKFEMKLQI